LVILRVGKIIEERPTDESKVVIQQPPGKYSIEVESPDNRRSKAELTISDKDETLSMPIDKSAVPLNIQRLYESDKVQLQQPN